MLTIIITLFLVHQAPATFEELEIEKLVAYHTLKNFREQVEMDVTLGGRKYVTHRDTRKDGDRSHVIITDPDENELETINDGTTSWAIFHKNHTYYESTVIRAPYDPKQMLITAEPDSGNMTLVSDCPWQFAFSPPPVIRSSTMVREGRTELRKVVADAAAGTGKGVTITQWFLPNRWLLKKATVLGTGKEGPISATITVTQLDLDALLGPTDFQIDKSVERGYQRIAVGQNPTK